MTKEKISICIQKDWPLPPPSFQLVNGMIPIKNSLHIAVTFNKLEKTFRGGDYDFKKRKKKSCIIQH